MIKWIYAILFIGLLAISTSPVIARLLPLVPAAIIAFWRMTFASAMLWGYSSIRPQESIAPKNIRLVLAAGFLLAMHFIFWFSALKLTSIANTTVLGIVAPAFTLLFERLWYNRKLSWITITALLIILFGGIIVQGDDLGRVNSTGLGNIMAILSAVFLGSVFIIGAKVRKTTPVIAYTRMVYTVSAIVLLVSSLVLDNPLLGYSINNYFWLFILGLVPTLIGHTAFSYSVKFVSPTVIAAFPLGEPIIASYLAWILFAERVPFYVVGGGLIVFIGMIILIMNKQSE
jgi:drug/metabolite transporter (DMT)-like permease|tara:strand:+ start:418 stop:1278 length:861 start_codon:yes stop_codon:yes gene_type:complete